MWQLEKIAARKNSWDVSVLSSSVFLLLVLSSCPLFKLELAKELGLQLRSRSCNVQCEKNNWKKMISKMLWNPPWIITHIMRVGIRHAREEEDGRMRD